MKIKLLNTASGLKPLYDEDYDQKKRLRIGETYEVTIRLARNLDFHRKYFALIHCAWEYQNERMTEYFKNNVDVFRKTVEIAAGWCEPVFSIEKKEWMEIPKSVAFDKMDNTEFSDLYDRVKDVLFKYFLKHITCEEFEKNLINF